MKSLIVVSSSIAFLILLIVLSYKIVNKRNKAKIVISILVCVVTFTFGLFMKNPRSSKTLYVNHTSANQSEVIVEEDKILTAQELATKNQAQIGEFYNIYLTQDRNMDNSVACYNIISIRTSNEYKLNTSESIKNAVIIETVSLKDARTALGDNGTGYIYLLDQDGEEHYPSIYTQTGKENPEIILGSKETVENFKYVVIGGLNRTKNKGKDKILLEIK